MIAARKPVSEMERTRIALRCFTALDRFVCGRARREEFYDCADAVNIVEALCDRQKIDGEHMLHVSRAINGLAKAIRMPSGGMALDGEELLSLRHVVSTYDLMLGRLSQKSIATAQADVVMKICRQRENPENGVVVIE